MQCPKCDKLERKNIWKCTRCGAPLKGGMVFVTSISGSGADEYIKKTLDEAAMHGHGDYVKKCVRVQDVGDIMKQVAEDLWPDIRWEGILNTDERLLKSLRRHALDRLELEIASNTKLLHIVDLHMSFRWYAYLTRGFFPYELERFRPHIRFFVNLVDNLVTIQTRLGSSQWGKRKLLELLYWRDEELYLTDMFADMCGRVDSYLIGGGEPGHTLERLLWHPEMKKVYLSFPITAIVHDEDARREIESFRDELRKFLVVFYPRALIDYDQVAENEELKLLRDQVGDTTIQRDFRLIDQADAVVVYFPKKVSSMGVDAEMKYARATGKPIYEYCPEDLSGGPFEVRPRFFRKNRDEYLGLLRSEFPLGAEQFGAEMSDCSKS